MARDRSERDDEDLVRLYLTDIGQHALLTKEDEVRLAQAIEAGAEAAAALARSAELRPTRRRELRLTVRHGQQAESVLQRVVRTEEQLDALAASRRRVDSLLLGAAPLPS